MAAFVEKYVRVFSALALLLFTFGCAKAAIEQKAFNEIKAKGGAVELRGKGPAITFYDVQIKDEDLACITPLEKVQSVKLMFVPITDEGLEHLLRLEKLAGFTYRKTGITPAGIEKLKKKFPEIVITEK